MALHRVLLKPKHSLQHRAHHHRRRPDLVRRTRRERLVVIAGKHFRHMAQRSIQRQQRIRTQVVIRGKRLVIAILRNRRPPGEQRPHGPVVISAAAENWRTIRNNPHAPVGLDIGIRNLLNRGTACASLGSPNHIGTVANTVGSSTCLSFLSERKCKSLLLRNPETVIHQRLLLLEFFR